MSTAHPDLSRLAAGALEGDRRQRAMDHLASCEACRRSYQTMVEAERMLAHGDPDLPSAPELDRIMQRVVRPSRPAPWRSRGALIFGLPATAAACGLLAFLSLRTPDEFSERSAPPRRGDGVRALCQGPKETRFAEADRLTCPRGHAVVVVVRNASRGEARVHLWLQDAAGALHLPAGHSEDGVALRRSPQEQVVETDFDLDASVALGQATLSVALCDRCTLAQARATAAAARAGVDVYQIALQIEARP